MGNRYIKIGLVILLAVSAGCEKLDLRGAFRSYESVNERFAQSMQWNDEYGYREVHVDDNKYTLFVMGDSHIGSTENLNLFMNGAIDANAAAVIMAGDITSGNQADYKILRQQLEHYDQMINFPIVGNHDLYFDGWKRGFKRLFGTSTYYFTVHTPTTKDLFICLDTGSGTLGGDQIEWLKQTLENDRQNFNRCILLTHVNLFRERQTTSTNIMVEELRLLSDLSIRHNINMVIAGHDHRRNVLELGNTIHMTLDAIVDGFAHASYLVLEMSSDAVDYRFEEL